MLWFYIKCMIVQQSNRTKSCFFFLAFRHSLTFSCTHFYNELIVVAFVHFLLFHNTVGYFAYFKLSVQNGPLQKHVNSRPAPAGFLLDHTWEGLPTTCEWSCVGSGLCPLPYQRYNAGSSKLLDGGSVRSN